MAQPFCVVDVLVSRQSPACAAEQRLVGMRKSRRSVRRHEGILVLQRAPGLGTTEPENRRGGGGERPLPCVLALRDIQIAVGTEGQAAQSEEFSRRGRLGVQDLLLLDYEIEIECVVIVDRRAPGLA